MNREAGLGAGDRAGPAALPCAGIRVLDIGTFVAAPFAATILGEFGADVIKIEDPTAGDPWRRYGTATDREGDTLAWLSEARNKRSVPVDLRAERGQEIFKRLVAVCDVVCENFRPGTLERWGLGPRELAAVNPGIVLLRVSGYGQTGPYAERPGFARIAQAFGGLTHLAGMPDGPPVTPGSTSLADYTSGLYGALGVLLALRSRDRNGVGQEVDVALYESIFRLLDELAPAYAANGTVRDREGIGTALAVPHGHFRTGDDRWVAIACTSDRMFARLCDVMGCPQLAAADRFGTMTARLADRVRVDGLVQSYTGARTQEQVVAQCTAGQVPCGPINSIEDIFADEHVAARGSLVEVPVSGDVPPVVVPGVLPRLSGTPGRIESAGPAFADSVDDVLGTLLGLSRAQMVALQDASVVGRPGGLDR